MNFRYIAYFVEAVKCRSLSAVAKRQNVTVQAVSKGINELEREVGTRLLIRGNQGVKPTALGYALYQRSLEAVEGFSQLEKFAGRIPAGGSSNGLLLSLCIPQLEGGAQTLRRLSRRLGRQLGIQLEIFAAPVEPSLKALRDGTVDVVCTIGEYSASDTDCIPIGNLPSGIGVAETHPLAERKTVRIADLAPYPVMWSEHFDASNHSILSLCLERGLPSPVVRFGADGKVDPPDADLSQAYSFMAYLPSFSKPLRKSRLIPMDPDDGICAPVCLVTLRGPKPEAYRALESGIGALIGASGGVVAP